MPTDPNPGMFQLPDRPRPATPCPVQPCNVLYPGSGTAGSTLAAGLQASTIVHHQCSICHKYAFIFHMQAFHFPKPAAVTSVQKFINQHIDSLNNDLFS
jgi:hypothetical protein